MDFNFNEEQTLIQGQVAQFIQRDYEWEKRQNFYHRYLPWIRSRTLPRIRRYGTRD